jgi:dTDP-4-dehydrorhamnose reductase
MTTDKLQRSLVVGAKGMLGATLCRILAERGGDVTGLDMPDIDITSVESAAGVFKRVAPQVVYNCAAYTDVDGCETNEETAHAVNARGVGVLAEQAAAIGAAMVHVSTDYVFDGSKTTAYVEEDITSPISAYGRTKLAGEEALSAQKPANWYILRTSWLYGQGGKNFVDTIARLALEREELRVVADQFGCPTYTEELAAGMIALVEADAESGVYHFSGEGETSWHGFATAIVEELRRLGAKVKAEQVVPVKTGEFPTVAERPAYSVMSKDKFYGAAGWRPAQWRETLARYLENYFLQSN